MIRLFPRAKAYFIMSEALVFLIGSALYYDGKPIYWSISAWILLGAIAYLGVSVYAVGQNNRLLAVLFVNMMPVQFIKLYLPLLKTPHLKKNVLFQMQNYIVTAYTAAGEFNKALDMLDSMEILPGRVEEQCKEIVASARCNIFICKGEISRAQEQYELIKASGRSNKTNNNDAEIFKIRMDLSENITSKESNDLLREAMKKAALPLMKNEMKLYLGQSHYLLGDEEFGHSYLKEVSSCPDELFIAKQAKKQLKANLKSSG